MHALVKLVSILCALLLINKYNFNFNILLFFLIIIFSFYSKVSIPKLIYKLKFFLIITFLLYVFNTPGEYIVVWPYLSPSYEGLSLGLTQIIRLLNSVAIITMMISLMSYQTLIETFYLIIKPFRSLGIDAKRFAVRLYLTMEYVKTFESRRNLRFSFKDLSSLLLYSYDKDAVKHTYIKIKQERVDGMSQLVIFVMLSSTFFLIL